jgi:threo-3-hydroxy-L-aspartate ammonia-lyase
MSLTYVDVRQAAKRLAGVAHRTPVLTCRAADTLTGARIFFKCENFQRGGAFKFRGAYNAVALLGENEKHAGVVTFSSGNHGQALALAARLLSVRATVVLPHDAPAIKKSAIQEYGGELVVYDREREDREAIARRLAAERGLTLILPFDHPHIIAGQGTAAKELFEETGPLDLLIVGLGGGGLLAGSALSARELSPDCRVIGVEPENGNDGQQSLRAGHIVAIALPATIADGARTTHIGEHTFAVMRQYVPEVVTVSDAQLVETMRFFFERMKIVVEPTGALAAAAVLHRKIAIEGKRVGIIISGGNIDAATFNALVAGS